jgi:hypothetical protein
MYDSSIDHWCGRFGNNIQQLVNGIYYSQENELTFISPDNDLINPFTVSFGDGIAQSNIYFFHVNSVTKQGNANFSCNVSELKKSRREIGKYIFPNLKVNFNNIKKMDNNTIVIHIRSGDIFTRKNYYCPVVSRYIQNPLKYYTDIIKNFDRCIILTEDYMNPVTSELEKLPNVEVKITSLKETIEIMLSATNLASSGISSFPVACAILSENIENMYTSNIYLDEILNHTDLNGINVHITNIDFDRYMKNDEWLNNDEQLKLMLEYE